MNEKQIIQAVLKGDINSYEALVKRYHVGLIIHCDRLVNDRPAAEDIAQESFIKAFNSLANFRPDQSRFSTWLYKIATNKAIDYLRAEKRHIKVDNLDSLVEQAAPDYQAHETKLEIQSAVNRLQPPPLKQVIEAYYWRGESYQNIAKSLNVPINTVRTWLRRAKQQLRSELS